MEKSVRNLYLCAIKINIEMKKLLISALTVLALAGCKEKVDYKVSAGAVSGTSDAFVWQNDRTRFCVYGDSMENGCITPGIDVWSSGIDSISELANIQNLGCGATVPMIDDSLCFPAKNYESFQILSLTPDQVTFVLHYPKWKVGKYTVSLGKQITISAGQNFCKIIDVYNGNFDSLTVAAGIVRDDIRDERFTTDGFAFWQPEGRGLALLMPQADSVIRYSPDGHSLAVKTVYEGEALYSYIGTIQKNDSCVNAADWFEIVSAFKP